MSEQSKSRVGRAGQVVAAVITSVVVLSALWAASEVRGQASPSTSRRRPATVTKDEAPGKVPAKDSKAPAGRAKNSKLPEPQPVSFDTQDGVRLSATYYRSVLGAGAAPVLLLHMRDGSQREWKPLAEQLQAGGYAVLTLDFRGHGDSRTVDPQVYRRLDPVTRKPLKTLNPQTFRREDFLAMLEDVEAAKRFLIQRHNGTNSGGESAARSAGRAADASSPESAELNIAKLTVVGAELGATIATLWAARDWSWPDLPFRGRQGRDVMALVLISPAWNLPGVGLNPSKALAALRTHVPMMVVVGGKDVEGVRDAKRMVDVANAQASDVRALLKNEYPTDLKGTKLLGFDLGVEADILEFVRTNVQRKSVPWEKREAAL